MNLGEGSREFVPPPGMMKMKGNQKKQEEKGKTGGKSKLFLKHDYDVDFFSRFRVELPNLLINDAFTGWGVWGGECTHKSKAVTNLF